MANLVFFFYRIGMQVGWGLAGNQWLWFSLRITRAPRRAGGSPPRSVLGSALRSETRRGCKQRDVVANDLGWPLTFSDYTLHSSGPRRMGSGGRWNAPLPLPPPLAGSGPRSSGCGPLVNALATLLALLVPVALLKCIARTATARARARKWREVALRRRAERDVQVSQSPVVEIGFCGTGADQSVWLRSQTRRERLLTR